MVLQGSFVDMPYKIQKKIMDLELLKNMLVFPLLFLNQKPISQHA